MNKFSTSNPFNTRGDAARRLPHRVPRHARELVQTCATTGNSIRVRIEAAALDGNQSAGWDAYYENWQTRVAFRASSTCSAMKATWRDLEACARRHGVGLPSEVTPDIVHAFVQSMRDRGLAADSVSDRLAKVRHMFSLAVGELLQATNPAETVIAPAGSSKRRPIRSSPWRQDELEVVFGSDVYNGRNQRYGSSGEASYWVPVIVLCTGMTPEEVAGLTVEDIVDDGEGGYCFSVIERLNLEGESVGLDMVKAAHGQLASPMTARRRRNEVFVRRIPVSQELIGLGLFYYVDWVQAQGHLALFPELRVSHRGRRTEGFGRAFRRHGGCPNFCV